MQTLTQISVILQDHTHSFLSPCGGGGAECLFFLLLFWAPRGSSFLPERKGKVRGQNCGAGAVRGACPAQARGPCWLPRRRRASPPASHPVRPMYGWLEAVRAKRRSRAGRRAEREGGVAPAAVAATALVAASPPPPLSPAGAPRHSLSPPLSVM